MIDIILFLVLGVLIIPLILLSVSSDLDILKYYPILLILVASYINKLKLKYNDKELFTELYLTKPNTKLGYFSTCLINIFVLLIVILLAIRVSFDISFGEKFVLGVVYFIVLYLLANQGMDKLYAETENNHIYGAGYSVVVFITLSLVLMFVNLGDISSIDLSPNNRGNNNRGNNNRGNNNRGNNNRGNNNSGNTSTNNSGNTNNSSNNSGNTNNSSNNNRRNSNQKNKRLMNNVGVSNVNNLNVSA